MLGFPVILAGILGFVVLDHLPAPAEVTEDESESEDAMSRVKKIINDPEDIVAEVIDGRGARLAWHASRSSRA